ncbi:MAG: PAS domain S-box protein [Chloroflexaceae bacterium]|jgi:NarL family two-component system response regulator LiaR|nr:PAS domain S-box protein [Chloroflexaceae bacterium]
METITSEILPPLADLLEAQPLVVSPHTTLQNVLYRLEGRQHAVLVEDGGRLCGMFTRSDLVRLATFNMDVLALPLAHVMIQDSIALPTSHLQQPAAALHVFFSQRVAQLPVVGEDGTLLGLLAHDRFWRLAQLAPLLGERMIADCVIPVVPLAAASTSLQALARRMVRDQIACIVITDDESSSLPQPAGFVDEQTIALALRNGLNLAATPASAVIDQPLATITRQDSLWEAGQRMEQQGHPHLLVVDADGAALGMLTGYTVLQALIGLFAAQTPGPILNESGEGVVSLPADHSLVGPALTGQPAHPREGEHERRYRMMSELTSDYLQEYRFLFENSTDAIVLFDDEGHYVQVNDAACRVLGYTREQLLRMRVFDVLGQPDLVKLQPCLQEPRLQEPLERNERRIYQDDATMRELEYSVSRIGPNLYQSIFRDITERKQLEAQFQQQAAALAIVRERERLSHDMQGELEQSLGYMAARVQTLRTLLTENRTERAVAALNSLDTLVQELRQDVRDLTYEARGRLFAIAPEHTPFAPLRQLVQHWQTFYDFTIDAQITASLTRQQLPPHYEFALLRMAQEALTNVRLHAGVNRARMQVELTAGQLVLIVEDEGCGFDQTMARAALAHVGSDSGYGLRSMQVRAEELGGRLSLRTTPGQGTSVQVQVPLPRPHVVGYRARLLLVDANHALLTGLEQVFSNDSIEVVGWASNSDAAVEQAHMLRPDLVLMNVQLSGGNGIATTQAILAEHPDCRVVLLDAIEHETTMMQALQAGASGYLPISTNPNELARMLHRLAASDELLLAPGMAARGLRRLLPLPNADGAGTALAQLTPRQREVLRQAVQGSTYKEIGQQLGYSTRTIKYTMAETIKLLRVESRQAAERLFREQHAMGMHDAGG